jgi:hypothetical protein
MDLVEFVVRIVRLNFHGIGIVRFIVVRIVSASRAGENCNQAHHRDGQQKFLHELLLCILESAGTART